MDTRRPRPGEGILADELSEVRMLADRGRYADAQTLGEKVLKQHPEAADAHTAMGDVYAAQGRWNEAVHWYGASLELEFDPRVMEYLAAARARAVQAGTAPENLPVGPLPERPEAPEQTEERRRVLPLAVAGVLLATLLLFFAVRWATAPPGSDVPSGALPATPGVAGGPEGAQAPWPDPAAWAAAPTGPQVPGTEASGVRYPASVPAESENPPPVRYTGQPPVSEELALATTATQRRAAVGSTGIEKKIIRQMHMEKFQEGTSVPERASATVDAYSGLGIITIQAPRTADPRRLDHEVTVAAYQAGYSAMKADGRLRAAIVRCVSEITNERGESEDVVLFRAVVNRENLKYWMESGSKPSYQQMTSGILAGAWWDNEAVSRHLSAQEDRILKEGGRR